MAILAMAGCIGEMVQAGDRFDVPLLAIGDWAAYRTTDGERMELSILRSPAFSSIGAVQQSVLLRISNWTNAGDARTFVYDTCQRPVAVWTTKEGHDSFDFRMLLNPPPPLVPLAGQSIGTRESKEFVYSWGEDYVMRSWLTGPRVVESNLMWTGPPRISHPESWRAEYGLDSMPNRLVWDRMGQEEKDWNLEEHRPGGEPLRSECSSNSELEIRREVLTSRGLQTDPPFTYRMSQAVRAAEFAPGTLRDFLTAHPQAYIGSWNHVARVGDRPGWILEYRSTGAASSVAVECILAIDSPSDQQWSASVCTSASKARPAPDDVEMGRIGSSVASYAHWFELFKETWAATPTDGHFRIDDLGKLRGRLTLPRSPVYAHLGYDAADGTLSDLEGVPA